HPTPLGVSHWVLKSLGCFILQCNNREITAHIGGDFILNCKYDTNRFRYSKKYWCRGDNKNTCEILVDSELVAKTRQRFQIIDAAKRGLFVKVTNLQFGDTGVYWVGIDKVLENVYYYTLGNSITCQLFPSQPHRCDTGHTHLSHFTSN
uniref:Immunoglobulin V-set domain-containing protein n=1 Tax=Seriola dumerili TaxID=41447 RepID=A0A3B4TES2_SERDU